MTNLTYVQALEVAINAVSDEAVVEKLTALKAQMAKRNASGSSKPTKTQIANEAVKVEIAEALATVSEPVTVSELIALMGKDYTNQKISALLRQMVNDNKTVVKTIEKKVSRFALA